MGLYFIAHHWALFQYKDSLSRYRYPIIKKKTIVRMYYLYGGDHYTGKAALWVIKKSHLFFIMIYFSATIFKSCHWFGYMSTQNKQQTIIKLRNHVHPHILTQPCLGVRNPNLVIPVTADALPNCTNLSTGAASHKVRYVFFTISSQSFKCAHKAVSHIIIGQYFQIYL